MGKRSESTAAERRDAMLVLLRREQPAAWLARRVGVSEQTLYRWRDEFIAGGEAALADGKKGADSREREVRSLRKEIEGYSISLTHRSLVIIIWEHGKSNFLSLMHYHRITLRALLLLLLPFTVIAIVGCTPSVAPEGECNSVAPEPVASNPPTDVAGTTASFGLIARLPNVAPDLARLLDVELAGQSDEYKAAVRKLFSRQVLFCDGTNHPERVKVSFLTDADIQDRERSRTRVGPGETTVVLESSSGRHGYGDSYYDAMTLRDGAVVSLAFGIETILDSDGYTDMKFPTFVDVDFLDSLLPINTIEAIDLSHIPVTDTEMEALSRHLNLRHVDLVETEVTFEDVEPNKTIESINLGGEHMFAEGMGISDAGLTSLSRFSNLRELDFGRTSVTPARFTLLSGLRKLESITCCSNAPHTNYSPRFYYTPQFFDQLAKHKRLRKINLQFVKLNQQAVELLASLRDLEELTLAGICPTQITFDPFIGHPSLRSLNLTLECEENMLLALNNIPKLETLFLKVGGPDVEFTMHDLPKLQTVDLRPQRIVPGDEKGDFFWGATEISGSLPMMGASPTLEEIEEFGRVPWVSMRNLPSLELAALYMTDIYFGKTADFGTIELADLPILKKLTLTNTHGLLDVQGNLPGLEEFVLHGGREITTRNTFKMLPRFPNLKSLGIRYCYGEWHRGLSKEEIRPLFQLTQLENLELQNVEDEELTFELFLNLPRLERMHCAGCRFADTFEVSDHPALTHLSFRGGAPRTLVLRDLPKLETLRITIGQTTEEIKLVNCPRFQLSNLVNTWQIESFDLQGVNVEDFASLIVRIEQRNYAKKPLILCPDGSKTHVLPRKGM